MAAGLAPAVHRALPWWPCEPAQKRCQPVPNPAMSFMQAYHLGTGPRPSLLNHTLMVVPDKASFDICRAAGLPVLIDRAFPFQYWEINPWYPEG